MKTEILKMACVGGIIILGLVGCSQPNEGKNNISEFKIKNGSMPDANTAHEAIIAKVDTLIDYFSYASVMEVRFIQNDFALKGLKKNFKSENSAIQNEYNKEIDELNQRNLEIKTEVQEHVDQDSVLWYIFKTSMNDEMDELEKSIRVLGEREN
jgi:hypothetical protein